MTRSSPPSASAAAAGPNERPATRTGGCASATTRASSATARRQFSGTRTAPILLAANSSSMTSGPVRSRCATRAPGRTPEASSACASRLERSSSSRYVMARAPRPRAARRLRRAARRRAGGCYSRCVLLVARREELGDRLVDRGLLRRVEMARLVQDLQARAGDALGEDAAVLDGDHTVVAPVHDERRDGDPRQPPPAGVQSRRKELDAVRAVAERAREPLRDVLLDALRVVASAPRAVVERHRRPRP